MFQWMSTGEWQNATLEGQMLREGWSWGIELREKRCPETRGMAVGMGQEKSGPRDGKSE